MSAPAAAPGIRIEPVAADDRAALLRLAVATGSFTADAAEELLGAVLDGLREGTLPAGHAAALARSAPDSTVLGWTYFAPDPFARRVWNLWWIGVEPQAQGGGAGLALLRHAEQAAAAASAALLLIETSGLPSQARARRFYERAGYDACGRVPDFYAEGDDKHVFVRRIDRGG